MQEEIAKTLDDEAKRLDELYFQLADVLDVKASIILILTTFLATVAGQVLAIVNGISGPSFWVSLSKFLQVLTIVAAAISIVFTLFALRVRRFDAPPPPEEWLKNLSAWSKYYEGHEGGSKYLVPHFQRVWRELTSERIGNNRKLAEEKAKYNKFALKVTGVCLGSELFSLILLAFRSYNVAGVLRALVHL